MLQKEVPCISRRFLHTKFSASIASIASSVLLSPTRSQPSSSKPPLPPGAKENVSVVLRLNALASKLEKKSVLKKLDYNKVVVEQSNILPPKFDGDVIFKLPLVPPTLASTQAKPMAGMEKHYDGHV